MRRALLVIDVQNEYVTGRLPISYPGPHESPTNVGCAIDAAHPNRAIAAGADVPRGGRLESVA